MHGTPLAGPVLPTSDFLLVEVEVECLAWGTSPPLALSPMKVWATKNRLWAWGGPAHKKPECQREMACRRRYHEGRKRTKTQEGARRGLWQHVCVCVCVRKKIDVRAGREVTSFRSMNQHVWARRSIVKSARSPSNGVRVWKRHGTDEPKTTVEPLIKTEPPISFLYPVF